MSRSARPLAWWFPFATKLSLIFRLSTKSLNSLLVYAEPWSAMSVSGYPCSGKRCVSIAFISSLVVVAFTGTTIGHLVSWSTNTKKYRYRCFPVAGPSFPEKSDATV